MSGSRPAWIAPSVIAHRHLWFLLSPPPAERARSVNVTPELKEFGNTRLDFAAGRRGTRLATQPIKRPSVPLLCDERPISAQEAPT
jgi:hypothetical protein